MNWPIVLVLLGGLVGLQGCESVFHPRASEFLEQAHGKTGVETGLTLTKMMEHSLVKAKQESGEDGALADLHDQFHALKHVSCEMTDAQRESPGHATLVTLHKDMRTVFHQVWDHRKDQSLRNQHLDVFGQRLQEFRSALQTIPQ